MKKYKSIPNFELADYGGGVVSKWPATEPINYEQLNIRSGAYDWKIKPHRHSALYQLFYLTKGGFKVQLDDFHETITAPALLLVPPMTVHGFEYEEGSDGHVLGVFKSTMPELLPFIKDHSALLNVPFAVSGGGLKDYVDSFNECFVGIKSEFQGNDYGRTQALQSHVARLLVSVMRIQRELVPSPPQKASDGHHLANTFCALVEEHFTEHRKNEFYAEQLNISVSKLTQLCKQVLGNSPQKMTQDRVILEAKRQLSFTTKTAAEIAYGLGFSDPAYFSRFFKKATQITPQRFRTELDQIESEM